MHVCIVNLAINHINLFAFYSGDFMKKDPSPSYLVHSRSPLNECTLQKPFI